MGNAHSYHTYIGQENPYVNTTIAQATEVRMLALKNLAMNYEKLPEAIVASHSVLTHKS